MDLDVIYGFDSKVQMKRILKNKHTGYSLTKAPVCT